MICGIHSPALVIAALALMCSALSDAPVIKMLALCCTVSGILEESRLPYGSHRAV
jgi:hypothetical protein